MSDIPTVLDYGADATGTSECSSEIQAGIDACAGGVLYFPEGVYDVDTPLLVGYDLTTYPNPTQKGQFAAAYDGTRPGGRTQRTILRAMGHVVLNYTGAETTDYLLYYAAADPVNGGFGPTIEGLKLECNGNCRGLLMHHPPYGSQLADGVYVRHARQVGVDLLACYCADARGLSVQSKGIAIRAVGSNGVKISGGYASTYATNDWPDATDSTVSIAWSSYNPSVAQADMGTVTMLKGDHNVLEQISLEAIEAVGHPAVYGNLLDCPCFRNMRVEGFDGGTDVFRFGTGTLDCPRFEQIGYAGDACDRWMTFQGGVTDMIACQLQDAAGSVVDPVAQFSDGTEQSFHSAVRIVKPV